MRAHTRGRIERNEMPNFAMHLVMTRGMIIPDELADTIYPPDPDCPIRLPAWCHMFLAPKV
jgi:hypothetical protein